MKRNDSTFIFISFPQSSAIIRNTKQSVQATWNVYQIPCALTCLNNILRQTSSSSLSAAQMFLRHGSPKLITWPIEFPCFDQQLHTMAKSIRACQQYQGFISVLKYHRNSPSGHCPLSLPLHFTSLTRNRDVVRPRAIHVLRLNQGHLGRHLPLLLTNIVLGHLDRYRWPAVWIRVMLQRHHVYHRYSIRGRCL